MADKKITNNLRVFKDKETRTLSKADAEAFIKSFKHTLSLTSNPEDVLASFKTINFNVATLKRESVVLNAEFLGKENLDALKAKFPNLNYNESEQTITLPMQPPEEGHVEVYSRDSGTENEPNGGVFEVTITNEQGVKYTCFIDPLGVTIKDLNGIVVAEQRADFESITQEQILDADFSPELIEMIMAGKGPLKSPETIKKLSPQLLDLYFKNGVSSAESRLKKDENNALFLGNENGFQIMALPTPKSNEKPPEFYYLIKDKDGRKFVRDGQTFVPFEKFNYIIGHTDKETKDKPFVLFNNNKGHEQNRFVQIPLDSNGNPDPKFAKAIEAFVENNPSRGKGDTVGLDGKPVSKDDKNQIAFQHADIDSAKHIVKKTGISTISADAGQETTPNNINQPQAPNANPPRSSTHSGPRVNPFKQTPLKTIKKPPVKINEDAVRYGGIVLSIFMLILAFILPVAIAPLFGFLAVGTLVGSTVIANKAKEINDNPVNKAYNKYVSTLAKAEREAESEAGKFWEAETERGNAYDRYQEFLSQINGEDFKNSLQGALFARFVENGAWTENEFKSFWSQDNIEMREAFLEDLQNLYAMQENTQEEINAKTQQQTQFLQKFGLLKGNESSAQIQELLGIFNQPLQVQNPENGQPMEIGAADLIKSSITYLKNFNEIEDKMFNAHDIVGDIIENCSGKTLNKILNQKAVDLSRFIDEHFHDIARRFTLRNDIPASQKQELLSKFTPEQVEEFKQAREEVLQAINISQNAGLMQKIHDDKFNEVMQVLYTLDNINDDKYFDNANLKTFAEIKKSATDLLWAIHAEDVKRLTNQSKTSQDLSIDNLSQALSGDANSIALYNVKLEDNYQNLLKTRHELLNNPKISSIIADKIVNAGRLTTPLTSLSFASADESSLTKTFEELLENDNLDDNTRNQIEQVLKISNVRKESLDSIASHAADSILNSQGKDSKCFSGFSSDDIEKMQEKIKSNNAMFATLPNQLQDKIARLYLAKENVFSSIDSIEGTTESEKELAKHEYQNILQKLTDGSFAEEKLERVERQTFESETDKPQTILTRAEASDKTVAMNNLLYYYGYRGKKLGGTRIKIMQELDRLSQGNKISKETLTQAIYNINRNLKVEDCSQSYTHDNVSLQNLFNLVLGENIDVNDKEQISKVKNKVQTLRETHRSRSMRRLRAYQQIAGCEEVEKVFNSSAKGKHVDFSIQNGSYTPSRAEIKLATIKRKKSEFNAGSNQVLESMQTIGKDMKDPTVSKTIMKNQIENLQDSIEKAFGTKAMKDLFDDEHGKDALSWEKLKSGKITEQEFKTLIEKINKLIKKKEKKLNSKLKKRKEKANKNKTKGRAKNKAKDGQDIANNIESTDQALPSFANNNSQSPSSTQVTQSSSASKSSSQDSESGN